MKAAILLCFSFFLLSGLAARPDYTFQHLDIDDGLSSNKVYTSLEDRKGYMWLATPRGISRFDGQKLTTYPLDSLQAPTQVYSLSLAEDSKGVLWLALSNGLVYRYDEVSDQFSFYTAFTYDSLLITYISCFYIDHQDRFFIGAFNGMYVFTPTTKSLSKLTHVNAEVSSIVKSSDHTYYLGTSAGIAVFDEDLSFRYNLKDKMRSGEWIAEGKKIRSLLLKEDTHTLWFGTEESQLFQYDLLTHELSPPIQLIEQAYLRLLSLVELEENKLMIGTDGGGIFIYDTQHQEIIEQVIAEEDNIRSLSSNAVYHIAIHSQGVIFICTRQGVNIYNPYLPPFASLTHERGNPSSISSNVVYSLSSPSPEVISFGTNKGLSIWNKKQGTWQHISLDRDPNSSKSQVAWAQSIDNSRTIWTASFTFPLTLFTQQGNSYAFGGTAPEPYQFPLIKDLYHHPGGQLLIGTDLSGLHMYARNGEHYTFPLQAAENFQLLSADKVLMSYRDGLALLDLAMHEAHPIQHERVQQTLEGKAVVSMLLDTDQNLWVGTLRSGIFRFSAAFEEVTALNHSTGLAANSILDLLEDQQGAIWVATPQGLSKIRPSETGTYRIENYFKSDGLISTDFNNHTGLATEDGNLYFGTNQGVIFFNPDQINPYQGQKKLILETFSLNHKRMAVGENSPLTKPIDEAQSITLSHQQNSFSIALSVIDFLQPDKGSLSWKLEGFDREWIAANRQTQATYTNLNPGHYTFKVRLLDTFGELLGAEREVEIHIRQPFWLTPPAFILYSLLLFSLIWVAWYFSRLKIQSRISAQRLQALVEMAHEVKTPLTLIRASISDILKRSADNIELEESLDVALNSADNLHQQMMQFVEFKRLQALQPNLHLEEIDLIHFLKTKLIAFRAVADQSKLELRADFPDESLLAHTDRDMLDRIVNNLLSNALKYTPSGGEIHVSLKREAERWILRVKDTGIGIPKKNQKRLFSMFFRASNAVASNVVGNGMGLYMARELAKKLWGDLRLEHSGPEGSAFLLEMPMHASGALSIAQHVIEENTYDSAARNEPEIRKRILIVEDSPELRTYTAKQFADRYQVQTASNGIEALSLIQQSPPDLIISDIRMPQMDGRQLCETLKSEVATSHILFILLTGMESKAAIRQGYASGADDYIVKPVDFDLLHTKVDNLLLTQSAIQQQFSPFEKVPNYQHLESDLDRTFLEDITRLIEENIALPELSVNFICQSIGMSRTSFYHKLKSLVDLSPAEFIRTLRLNHAKQLLHNPSLNVSEVAYRSGFSDAKYFSTLFKKYFQESPSQYRQKIGGH